MVIQVKQEPLDNGMRTVPSTNTNTTYIPYSSSDFNSVFMEQNGVNGTLCKKRNINDEEVVLDALPIGFLDPLTPEERLAMSGRLSLNVNSLSYNNRREEVKENACIVDVQSRCKQFWKAGDYMACVEDCDSNSLYAGIDRARVHPRFLHSNATSHKWALGAFAELLDNALDEICNGATYVQVDMLKNEKDAHSRMLLIEDNGGGMTPDKMRKCMSLGYSAKSNMANTIGQYGNGFKTSTMRLGADAIVFTRCPGQDGKSPTQTVGMLSYTFLRETGKEDIVVPMIDFEKRGDNWTTMGRSSSVDWQKNMEILVQWSPYSSEDELLQQFNFLKDQGTRIIVYNLWEDDEGQLELDFDTDPYDIQIRGVNRDPKNIDMAKEYPNSRHFLTYRHSLRSYVAILYLRLPANFRIILRGKEVEHHNIIDDMMHPLEVEYRPSQLSEDGKKKDKNMMAIVTLGFVKDAKAHIDVQGFNVYHKNRLIKPFWRVWNAAGSDGRGVIGVLEANFVNPAHDKQGFERTDVLDRLQRRLVAIQKKYWSSNCQEIGYAKRRKTVSEVEDRPSVGDKSHEHSTPNGARTNDAREKLTPVRKCEAKNLTNDAREKLTPVRKCEAKKQEESPKINVMPEIYVETPRINRYKAPSLQTRTEHLSPEATSTNGDRHVSGDKNQDTVAKLSEKIIEESQKVVNNLHLTQNTTVAKLSEENTEESQRTKTIDDAKVDVSCELQAVRARNVLLENQVLEAKEKIELLNQEQMHLLDLFSEEREQRNRVEENLRKRCQEATDTIEELLKQIKALKSMTIINCKTEPGSVTRRPY